MSELDNIGKTRRKVRGHFGRCTVDFFARTFHRRVKAGSFFGCIAIPNYSHPRHHASK